MARPCGCSGECACDVRGTNGITVTGTGSRLDPMLVGLASPITGNGCNSIMDCVGGHAGTGLRYDGTTKTLSAKLSNDSGNNLVLGSDNGLFTAGGGGGSAGGATVASLPTTDLIGGSYGAGNGQWPEGSIETYRAALDMGLKLIHVPVRRSTDSFLWAAAHYQLGNYNWRFSGETSNTMDLKMLHQMWWLPGGDPNINPSSGDITYQPQAGNFGYGWQQARSAVFLSDVFALTQRKAVLYLQVRDIGSLASDCPTPYDTYPLLQSQIRQWGAQQSVIVGSELPNNADRAGIVQGLQKLRTEDNVVIAAHITSTAMATANPPATLVSEGFTWVMIDFSIADTAAATVTAYKTAGLNVMLTNGHRQWHFNLQRTLALRGVLCLDPVYCAGILSSFSYKKPVGTWGWGTPDYGRYAYGTDQENMRDKYRGYVKNGEGGRIYIDGGTLAPHETDPNFRQSSYFILMGEQCPVRDTRVAANVVGSPNFYDIDVSVTWTSLTSDQGRHLSVFFAVPQDRPLTEWQLATTYTKGYMFSLSENGTFVFQRYDGGSNAAMFESWASPWGVVTPNAEYRLKVRVRPDRVIVGPADQSEGGAQTHTYTGANGGTMWRGAYFYLGRHFFSVADSTSIRFTNLVLTEGTSV